MANYHPVSRKSPETIFHGGHFHGQYVAMECDYLNIALTEIGVLAERPLSPPSMLPRLHRDH